VCVSPNEHDVMMDNFLDLDHLISGPVLAKGNKCNVVYDFHVFYIDS
jgi:hypothetical protein